MGNDLQSISPGAAEVNQSIAALASDSPDSAPLPSTDPDTVDAVLSTLAELVGAASASITKTVEELIAEIEIMVVDQTSNNNLVFGRAIGDVLTRESSNLIVPVIVYKVVAYLSKEENITQEGILRTSGCVDDVEALVAKFDRAERVVLEETNVGVSEVGSLLKKYISRLPTPLIPDEYFPKLNEALPTPEEFQAIVGKIPPENATLLEFIIALLRRIATYKDQNLMSYDNLCISIGPSLIPIGKGVTSPAEIIGLTKRNNQLVSILIENHELIFANVGKQDFVQDHKVFRVEKNWRQRIGESVDAVSLQLHQLAEELSTPDDGTSFFSTEQELQ